MKRLIILSMVLVFTISTASLMAQPRQLGGREMHCQKANILDLTGEQELQFDKLRLAHQKAMIPLREQLQALRTDYRLMVIDEKASKGDLEKQLDKIAGVRKDMGLQRAEHQRQLRSLLTDAQKVKFDAHILSNKRGFREGRMNRPHPNRPNRAPGRMQMR